MSYIPWRKPDGRFRRAPSLRELGYDVADSPKRCECGHEWQPVLVSGYCPKCGSDKGEMLAPSREPE